MPEHEVRFVGRRGYKILSSDTQAGVIEQGVDVYGIAMYDDAGVWEADYDLNSVDIVKAAVLLFNHEMINHDTLIGILRHLEIME